jgi:hypothetical protein
MAMKEMMKSAVEPTGDVESVGFQATEANQLTPV